MHENVYQALLQAAEADSLILTVNQRLAAYLQEQDAFYQKQAGRAVLNADRIMPISAWLEQLWQRAWMQARQLPLVLSADQEQVIWQQVIAAADTEDTLLSTRAAARQAQKAWRLLKEWRLSYSDSVEDSSEDAAAFYLWAGRFDTQCQQQQWISEAERPQYLAEWLSQSNGSIQLPRRIYLLGFIDIAPHLQHLFTICQAAGSQIQHWSLPDQAAPVMVLPCHDQDDEYRRAMQWAYETLQTDPELKLGLIIPELQNERLRIERLACEYFSTPDRPSVTYAISGGMALFDQPVVYDAWLILQLGQLSDYELLSRVFRSPFIAAAEQERSARDTLDRHLRETVLQQSGLASCMKLAGMSEQCPLLWQILSNYQQYQFSEPAGVTTWARYWLNLLHSMGWPGQRELNSQEYQAVASFYHCFERLEADSILAEQYDEKTLFLQFSEKLRSTVFQAQSPAQPAVQILGVLEASGLIFDQIALCGLHEDQWPAPARPNPFLPISLQRTYNMPHATAERELQFAETLFTELRKQCQVLRVSYPCWQGDVQLAPSPLLREFPESTQEVAAWRYADSQQPEILETFDDVMAPPLSMAEHLSAEGGYKIFQQQALCPFQAFASRRLRVGAFPQFTDYLDNRIRGILLHGILERIWRELNTQARLLAMSELERAGLVKRIVQQMLRYWQQRYPQLLTRALVALEQQRLEDLLIAWLAIEAERPPFKVLAQEETVVSELAGIPLTMRIDRIDQLANGAKVVIDYKTGVVNCTNWFGERPSDPQLPLYALLTQAQAIVYAQLKCGKLGFSGVAEAAEYLPNVNTVAASKLTGAADWPSQLQTWQNVLDKLGRDFRQGRADVSPKSEADACRHCDLQALCRINETHSVLQEE